MQTSNLANVSSRKFVNHLMMHYRTTPDCWMVLGTKLWTQSKMQPPNAFYRLKCSSENKWRSNLKRAVMNLGRFMLLRKSRSAATNFGKVWHYPGLPENQKVQKNTILALKKRRKKFGTPWYRIYKSLLPEFLKSILGVRRNHLFICKTF